MIFQFVGLPSSGKTTALVKLSGKFRIINLSGKKETFLFFFYFFLFNPFSTLRTLYLFFKYRPEFYSFWNYYVSRCAKLQKGMMYSKGNPCLIDEPPLQNIYSLMKNEVNEKDLALIYKYLPSSGKIIYFSVDENVRQDRLKVRNRSMRNEHDPSWNKRLLLSDLYLQDRLKERNDVFFTSGNLNEIEQYVKENS